MVTPIFFKKMPPAPFKTSIIPTKKTLADRYRCQVKTLRDKVSATLVSSGIVEKNTNAENLLNEIILESYEIEENK